MAQILEIDSIYKFISLHLTISDIYLKCETGDIIGIFGRNGAGKSTLLKIIFGTKKAENQFIRINNKIIQRPYKSGGLLAYLPQHHFLPKELKVRKIINFYLASDIIETIAKDEIIQKIWHKTIATLADGVLRYLEILLILKSSVPFVLLDEPLNTLAPNVKNKVIHLIKDESKNKGIILTDHDYRSLEYTVTKVYLMLDGSLKPVTGKEDLIFGKYLPNDY